MIEINQYISTHGPVEMINQYIPTRGPVEMINQYIPTHGPVEKMSSCIRAAKLNIVVVTKRNALLLKLC